MKKHLCLLLAAALLLGGLAGCGPIGTSGPSETPSASVGTSESADGAETQRYQIADGVFITPVKADKPPEQLSDEEMTRIAAELLNQANLLWTYLFAGIPDLAVDQADSIVYDDGEKWDSLKYIHSFAGYQAIVDSVFAKNFYSDHISKFIKECMTEQNGKLYLCKARVGSIPDDVGMESNGIEMVRGEKEADGIQAYVRMKDADPDHASYPDILTRYTLLRQNGDWVLQSFRGETTGLDFLQPLQPPFPAPSGSANLSIPADTKTAAPDFMDAQQQELYRKAYNFAPVFLFDSSEIDDIFGDLPPHLLLDVVGIDGDELCKAQGRFRKSGDFTAASLALFTPDCFESLAEIGFRNGNGTLYYRIGGRGSDPFYAFDQIPNTFRLVHKDENRIEFLLIGHYYTELYGQWIEEGSPGELKTTTKEFPVVMENTPDGWRFSEFHIPF